MEIYKPHLQGIMEFAEEPGEPLIIADDNLQAETIAAHGKALDYYRTMDERSGLRRRILGILAMAYIPTALKFPEINVSEVKTAISELNIELEPLGLMIVQRGNQAILIDKEIGHVILVLTHELTAELKKYRSLKANIHFNTKILDYSLPKEDEIMEFAEKKLQQHLTGNLVSEPVPSYISEKLYNRIRILSVHLIIKTVTKMFDEDDIYLKHISPVNVKDIRNDIKFLISKTNQKQAIARIIELLPAYSDNIKQTMSKELAKKLHKLKDLDVPGLIFSVMEECKADS